MIIITQNLAFFFLFKCKIVKKKELIDFECEKIIGFYEADDSERTISKKTSYGKTTIHNIKAKYCKTDAVSITSRSGRPKKLTERDKHYLKTIITKNRHEPVEKINEIFTESTEKRVYKHTMQQTLYEIGYNSCTAFRKPNINERN